MQVTEKSIEGLSRTYGVTGPAPELDALLDARIAEITPTLRLKGFRPGKVPQAHIRRVYGKALMGEVVEKTLSEISQKVLEDNRLRIAAQPDLAPTSDMEKVLAGKEDLAYEISVEVMPDFEPVDVSGLELQRPVYRAEESEIDDALAEVVSQNRTYEARVGKGAKARAGDQLVIDFAGEIDGQPFEGGTAEDAQIVLGEGRFLPGFEDGLIAAAPGDERTIRTNFPADYAVARLKGKTAEFKVKVKEVRAPKEAVADDALAVRLGLADLEALKGAIRANLQSQYAGASRFKIKRALLDALDVRHQIALPAKMVEAEFAGIWAQLEADTAKGEVSPEDEGKSEETLRAEYRRIAERRVRLGLVLAEIGRRADIQITDQELSEAMREEAMRYGSQAQQVFDMLRQNPNAQAQIRAPLYEEKVVDHILSLAKVTEAAVSKEELLKEDEVPETYAAPSAKPAGKRKPKASRAKATSVAKTGTPAPKPPGKVAKVRPAKSGPAGA
ncbi:MAG: trigger factor [Caulobacteraceae bacterium]